MKYRIVEQTFQNGNKKFIIQKARNPDSMPYLAKDWIFQSERDTLEAAKTRLNDLIEMERGSNLVKQEVVFAVNLDLGTPKA